MGRVVGVAVPMRFEGRRHTAVAGSFRALDQEAAEERTRRTMEKRKRRSMQLGLAPLAGPDARGAVVSLRF